MRLFSGLTDLILIASTGTVRVRSTHEREGEFGNLQQLFVSLMQVPRYAVSALFFLSADER